ncbi:hypothetical protein [Larsenimonas rhizosphaerae]|uniref:STAS domain-containing protein n=1 Tax=Larsenimonas rhizosphaerae TaxID=2944682 RepID=A0AA41ZFI3_9GAMM|nr:hypothetical protein [Larsenimonas rhizosphaerae]MCM2130910.1 hypothetical protein [Larsenimonas rhizosphaerae]MCX2523615.1 hypothetical protein [Larsenimonas rhizosphaerae]
MRYIFSLDDNNTLLVPPEQFTGDDARTFRAMISDYLGCNPSVLATRIYLDARPITRIDADGLSAMVAIHSLLAPAPLTLLEPSEALTRTLESLRLFEHFDIYFDRKYLLTGVVTRPDELQESSLRAHP